MATPLVQYEFIGLALDIILLKGSQTVLDSLALLFTAKKDLSGVNRAADVLGALQCGSDGARRVFVRMEGSRVRSSRRSQI